jgi:hypothetical protein
MIHTFRQATNLFRTSCALHRVSPSSRICYTAAPNQFSGVGRTQTLFRIGAWCSLQGRASDQGLNDKQCLETSCTTARQRSTKTLTDDVIENSNLLTSLLNTPSQSSCEPLRLRLQGNQRNDNIRVNVSYEISDTRSFSVVTAVELQATIMVNSFGIFIFRHSAHIAVKHRKRISLKVDVCTADRGNLDPTPP